MSKPGITSYHRAESVEDAWQRISEGDPSVRLLSGGADLTIHAPPEVTALVDVGRVLGRSIDVADDGSVRIGAMATLTDVMDHADIARHAGGVIPEMMVHVGNPLLRNFSSIGGHMARGKLSDVVPVFLALDAGIGFYDGAEGSMSLADYYAGNHHSSPHIVTDLRLPALRQQSAASFLRFARTAFDFAILNVCCRVDVDNDQIREVRIVCGSTPYRAHRAATAEAWIAEHGLNPPSIDTAAMLAKEEVPTRSGWVASGEYRSHLVEVLTRRSLSAVAERLEAP